MKEGVSQQPPSTLIKLPIKKFLLNKSLYPYLFICKNSNNFQNMGKMSVKLCFLIKKLADS